MLPNNSSLLFVCTGNTCRSPMAEYMALEMALKKGPDIKVVSRGISASQKYGFALGPTIEACRAVRAIYPQSKIYKHRPMPLTYDDLEQPGLILTMEEVQRDKILAEAQEFIPGLEERVFALKEFALIEGAYPINVVDPMGGGSSYDPENPTPSPDRQTIYNARRDEIIQCLDAIFLNPTPDCKHIITLRNQRKQAFIQKEIDSDIAEYQTILTALALAPEGEIVELTYSQISDIEHPERVSKSKDYLLPILEQIAGHVKTKNLDLTANKAFAKKRKVPASVSDEVSQAVDTLNATLELTASLDSAPAVQGTPKKKTWLASLFNW